MLELDAVGRPRASSFLIRVAARAAERAGLSPDALYRECGFDPSRLDDPDARVSEEDVAVVWTSAALLTSDPCFGIACAEAVDPLRDHLLFYLIGTSPTLAEAITLAERYQSLVHHRTRFEVRVEHGVLRGILRGDHDLYTAGAAQFGFSLFVRFVRAATGLPILPKSVSFRHVPLGTTDPYTRWLGPDIRFGGETDEIVFEEGLLSLPLVTHDPTLGRYLLQTSENARQSLGEDDPFRISLRQAIEALLPSGQASLARVAKHLGLSERTIQRKLQERDTAFSEEVESVRRTQAEVALSSTHERVGAIAERLGFSDATSFSRAFARWFGCSPREFRHARRV